MRLVNPFSGKVSVGTGREGQRGFCLTNPNRSFKPSETPKVSPEKCLLSKNKVTCVKGRRITSTIEVLSRDKDRVPFVCDMSI